MRGTAWLIVGALVASCTMMDSRDDRADAQAVSAAGGNVLGILFDRRERTTTILSGLAGSGSGTWHGQPADRKLTRAQAAALRIANLEAQAKYPFEQPKLYAHVPEAGGTATFDRLEAHLPADAVRVRSGDIAVVLRSIGAFAGREAEPVRIEAPDEASLAYLTGELRAGAAPRWIDIVTGIASEPRVIVGAQ